MKLTFKIIIGLLSVLIFIYRLIFLMYPMLSSGIKKNDMVMIFDSLTLLV